MHDVTGVNVFPSKLMKFPREEKVNSVPYPLLSLANTFVCTCVFFFIKLTWDYTLRRLTKTIFFYGAL